MNSSETSFPAMDRPETETHELLSRFMISQGIPYSAIDSGPFRDLLHHFNPEIVLPEAHTLEQTTETMRVRRVGKLQGVRAIVVTYDVFGGVDDDKFLVFSVHFPAPQFTRKNLIYMRRIAGSIINTKIIFDTIKAIIKSDQYIHSRISQIVTPHEKLAQFTNVTKDTSQTKYFTCFYHHITTFAERILKMGQLPAKIQQFRNLVWVIRSDPELVAIFTRVDPSLGTCRTLPTSDNGGWQSTARFLWQCIPMYEELVDFAEHYRISFDISQEEFLEVKFFYTILEHCGNFARSVSGEHSSISQVIPTIMMMRRFIFNHSKTHKFKEEIREALVGVFKKVTSGEQRQLFDMATLLDPRFGYRKDLYSEAVWEDIEKKLAAKMFTWAQTGVACGNRVKALEAEIKNYRRICLINRPAEDEDPMDWWRTNQPKCARVAAMAHEMFVTPAVSIDASYFFGVGGKFNHLLHDVSSKHSEVCLEMAGYGQPFRGRGLNHSEHSGADQIDMVTTAKRKVDSSFVAKRARAAEEQKPPILLSGIKEEEPELRLVKQEEPDSELAESIAYAESDLLSGCWEHKQIAVAPRVSEVIQEPKLNFPPIRSARADRRHYCVICGKRQQAPYIRHVKIDSEKLFLCIGALHLKMIELDEARDFYRRNQIVVCRKHFVDFSHAFFEHLKVGGYEDIHYTPDQDLDELMKISLSISMQILDIADFRSILVTFTRKNFNLPDRRALRATDIRMIENALTNQSNSIEVPVDDEYAAEEMEDPIFE